jgi:hypothetical protein
LWGTAGEWLFPDWKLAHVVKDSGLDERGNCASFMWLREWCQRDREVKNSPKIVVNEKDLFNFCGAEMDRADESSGRKLMRSLGELNRR